MHPKSISNTLIGGFLLLALIGFADAAYLTLKHYTNAIPPCSLVSGCETVLTSPYATIGSVPISLVGAVYYLALFILTIAYIDSKNVFVLKTAAYFTWVGLLASAGLMALQLFVIRALCLYCIASALTSTLLFILGIVILRKLKQSNIIENMPVLMR
ncbi:MAG: hypothetical protein G01um101429_529 [Parcubacteria group bacterium Gr01-1014_29]|nr:MAG: hypothetical protein G01um101429_529 [Parcubacteria group bacterium Gr01-1014_29]